MEQKYNTGKQSEIKLIVFENKILGRTFWEIQENGEWLMRNNRKLRNQYEYPNIVALVKSKVLR